MSYGSLSHTADVGIKVEGYSFEELFKNSLKGMNSILKKGFCDTITHCDCIIRIQTASSDITNLLIDFLSEVLAFTYVQKAIYYDVIFSHLSETKLDAHIYGAWFDHFDEEIKAVTYHEAKVIRNEEGKWQTDIIFDI